MRLFPAFGLATGGIQDRGQGRAQAFDVLLADQGAHAEQARALGEDADLASDRVVRGDGRDGGKEALLHIDDQQGRGRGIQAEGHGSTCLEDHHRDRRGGLDGIGVHVDVALVAGELDQGPGLDLDALAVDLQVAGA